MGVLVDADSASLPTAPTGGDASQQSEIVSRGNRSWYTATAEDVGPEARRVEMLGGSTRESKSVDDGGVEAWLECCTQHVGKKKART